MKTYNSYEEAKIANPGCEIVTDTQKSIDKFGTEKRYHPVINNSLFTSGYEYLHSKGASPRVHDGYFDLCNPADHCMTVEKFLGDGHKFVEGKGDAYLDNKGIVRFIGDNGYSDWGCNDVTCIDGSRESYILRAAALEEKPANKVAKALGRPLTPSDFGVALDEKPKRVKVEWVKIDKHTSVFSLADDYHNGLLTDSNKDQIKSEIHLMEILTSDLLYKRIETEIDERQEFIDEVERISECVANEGSDWSFACIASKMYDSGKFKLVEGE